ncbi:HYR domain-containing protein [Mariprofundus erugo]|uniref:HYR domain-containing protein n=1 Tax=Mariprofundus erugo TaxID=2528639 RepID=UPI0010FE1BE2|nr:HYR domain-containing protein [Mariprofundus erugo]TLS74950.1 HYR domain-containing protein [Mariprofundus erugo]
MASAAVGDITTVAGTGGNASTGDGGPATSAQLMGPADVVVDAAGNLYISEFYGNKIRKVDTSGNISTVAGTGIRGGAGDGGAATAAQLTFPYGLAVDASGNLYGADRENHRIRKVNALGQISTVAGIGYAGYSGDGGPATAARVSHPEDVAVDGAGNIYIADMNNRRIRKVDVAGNISTLAGDGTDGFSGDGGPATSAQLMAPFAVTVDAVGNIYFADTYNRRVRKIDVAGNISTVAGDGTYGYSGDGGLATSAQLSVPLALAVDAAGSLFISDLMCIRKVDTSGIISTVAGTCNVSGFSGDGGPATSALLAFASGLAFDAVGNLYISDMVNNRVRKVEGVAAAASLYSDPSIQVYLPFDGDLNDASGHNANATMDIGAASFVANNSGQALSSVGTSVRAMVMLDVNEVNYTAAFRFKTTNGTGGLFEVGGSGYDRDVFLTGGDLCMYTWNKEKVCSNSGKNFADGQYHHVAHVLDGTNQILYVDGVELFRGNKGFSDFNWQDRINIGYSPWASFYHGEIDDVAVFKRALTAAEVARLAAEKAAPAAPANQPPVANAGAAQVVESAGAMTAVMLNGSASSDPDGDTLTYSWSWNGGSATGATPTVNLANGTYNISLTVDDGKGGTATATTTVTVRDTVAPSISIAPIAAVEATSVSGASVNVTSYVTTSDVCGVQLGVSPAGVYALGNTSVTVTATDCAGNSRSASTTVSVVDTTAPVLSVPANVSVEATARLTSVAIGAATATDIFAVTVSNNAPAAFPVGNTTVTWTATDANGNSATATQTVTVTDTTAPSVVAPAAVTVEATGALTAVTLGSASASDLVDGVVTATADQTGPFAPGVYTITWSATDAAGNTGKATQTVTVTDTTAPSVIAPAAVTVEATGALTAVTLGSATASDLVDGVVTATADQTGPFAPGVHTITWSATDAHGNVGTATQTVTVTDTTAPSVVAPAAVTVEATGALTAVTLGSASASDLVDGVVTASADQTGPFAPGVHTITWSATDAAGNTGTATQTVTVTDTTAPSVVAPAAVTVEATGALTAVTLGSASASDLVDGVVTATADQTGPFAPGVYTITWSATDAAGNTGTATQTVTVTDTTAPSVIAPAAVTVEATGALTAVTLGSASASDLVDGVVTATADQTGPFAPGVYTITWSATDAAGNTGTATQTVTVTDTTAPSVIAPAAVTVEATGALTAVTLGSASASDLVDGVVTATADQTGPFAPGVYTITWSATDAAGNTGTATQTVTVTDTTAPSVLAPADVTVEASAVLSTVAIGNATATDLVDGTVAATSNAPASFPVGTTVVIWSATDAAGNTGSATQKVTVVDTTAPVLTLPANVTAEANGNPGSTVAIGNATATDIFPVTVTSNAPAVFPLGVTSVIWSATDANGNVSTATQTVTVVDTTAPAMTLPADVHVEATAALSSVVIGTATATDLFGPVSVVSDAPVSFALGTTVVTWTATDANGNSSTGTQRVTVVDTTAPAVAAALEAVKVEGQEGVFRVVFSSHDLVDANPALSATLNGVTVSNGQSVHLSYGSRQKVEGGRNVEIEAPSFSLDVISTDASGNAGSAAAAYAFPAPREAHGDSKSDHGKQSESKSKSKSSKRD